MRSAVASGLFQNPVIWPSVRATISPTWPSGNGFNSSSQISTSAHGPNRPQDRNGVEPSISPNHWRGPMNETSSTSVWP